MALSAAHRRRSAFLPLDQPNGRSRIEQVAARSGRMIVSRATVSARSAGEDALCRLGHRCRAVAFWRQRRRRSAPVLIFAVWALFCAVSSASATQRFRADEWVTECGGNPDSRAADCSITVPFWQIGDTGKGSFALVVMLETGNIGIVGQPFPVKAVLRVDRKSVDRVPIDAILHFSEQPVFRGSQRTWGRFPGLDRRIHPEITFRLQPDDEGLSGRSGANSRLGLSASYRLIGAADRLVCANHHPNVAWPAPPAARLTFQLWSSISIGSSNGAQNSSDRAKTVKRAARGESRSSPADRRFPERPFISKE